MPITCESIDHLSLWLGQVSDVGPTPRILAQEIVSLISVKIRLVSLASWLP